MSLIAFLKAHSRAIWYSFALLIFLGGLGRILLNNDTLGFAIIVGSFILASTRFISDHISALDTQIEDLIIDLLSIKSLFATEGITSVRAKRALIAFKNAMAEIELGTIDIRNSKEYFQAFLDIVTTAKNTIHAVDQIDFLVWKTYLKKVDYLSLQEEAIKNGRIITRIRIVDRDRIRNADYKSDLKEYQEYQEKAGVHLYLCYRQDVHEISLIQVEKGWVLADKDCREHISGAVGILDKDGKVREGQFYLRDCGGVRKLKEEFDLLCDAIKRNGWDKSIRDTINSN
jgi:hypothetical protein